MTVVSTGACPMPPRSCRRRRRGPRGFIADRWGINIRGPLGVSRADPRGVSTPDPWASGLPTSPTYSSGVAGLSGLPLTAGRDMNSPFNRTGRVLSVQFVPDVLVVPGGVADAPCDRGVEGVEARLAVGPDL